MIKIQVFPDIPAEGLAIRRSLKPLLLCLQEAKTKYKWQPSVKLMLVHKYKPIFVWDLDSGEKLLQQFNLEEPMEQEVHSNKRKLVYGSSPQKNSKILVRHSNMNTYKYTSIVYEYKSFC